MVTGSNFLLETHTPGGEPFRVLIDCGLRQGSRYVERDNFEPFPFNPSEIKAVFVTHAHIDHTGLLPKLVKQGFNGKIYGTAPTRDFAYELLMDSQDILRREAEQLKEDFLYEASDVEKVVALWQTVKYKEEVMVGPIKATFRDVGHILGSMSPILTVEGKSIVFSGDLGNADPALIPKYDVLSDISPDYCVMESTYGDRMHENQNTRRDILEDVIEDAIKSGGTLMIPAFAMERTQDLLYEINELMEHGRIPNIHVFMDSPLAIKLTKVYEKYRDQLTPDVEKLTKHLGFFDFKMLKMTPTTEESKAINDAPNPKIIIAGSGMSNGGRILHHERRYLSDPKSTILFIGYQAAGTLGRRVLDGEPTVKMFGEEIAVRCKVRSISGYSAHADQKTLMEWIYPMRRSLKKVFLVHGEPEASTVLATKIKDILAVDAIAPALGSEVVL